MFSSFNYQKMYNGFFKPWLQAFSILLVQFVGDTLNIQRLIGIVRKTRSTAQGPIIVMFTLLRGHTREVKISPRQRQRVRERNFCVCRHNHF